MRHLLLILLFYSYNLSFGQTTYKEIKNKSIQKRVLHIRTETDSFLMKKVSSDVYKKLVADFGVTYLKGELFRNYLFLNESEDDSSNINDLKQYYYIDDKSLGLSENIGVYYSEFLGQFAPKANNIKIEFATAEDSLKAEALNYLYQSLTQKKLKQWIVISKFTSPIVKIFVNAKSSTWFIFLKDKLKQYSMSL